MLMPMLVKSYFCIGKIVFRRRLSKDVLFFRSDFFCSIHSMKFVNRSQCVCKLSNSTIDEINSLLWFLSGTCAHIIKIADFRRAIPKRNVTCVCIDIRTEMAAKWLCQYFQWVSIALPIFQPISQVSKKYTATESFFDNESQFVTFYRFFERAREKRERERKEKKYSLLKCVPFFRKFHIT